ncbi:M20 metallopeptidase family protein [Kineococcus sp. SYSU DK002]|uniref:M20 metallopeptidase family protein n=1 Tax=Kineococcus sp. SYSU DK002 TaxID=3383123 RepID=UPI003D7E43C0
MDAAGDLIALRRALHADPEVGLDLPRTQEAVLAALDGLDLEIGTGRALSSVTAVLRGGRPGPTVLLRADMDALPVAEDTGLPYAATNGAMHACGHDLHTAGLVGAARLLHAGRDTLPGDVVLAFQPGEEGFGGGRVMLEEGLLDASGERPVAAYAIHVDSQFPAGRCTTRPGPVMAGASALRITVTGTGGHAARPHAGVDAVPVAAEVVLALQTFTARKLPATEPAVVSVTGIGTDSAAGNVLPRTVTLTLNVRTLSAAVLDRIRTELPPFVAGIGAAHGAAVETVFTPSYPVTVNDPAETASVLHLFGPRAEVLPEPSMASEDFAYVLERVPGTLLFLGAAVGEGTPLHSPRAVFDDAVLAGQAATLALLARARLARGSSIEAPDGEKLW